MTTLLPRLTSRLCLFGSGTCLILMVFIIIVSVMGRYLFHSDLIPGSFNIIERILFPILVFCAIPLSHQEGMFPSVTFFRTMLPKRAQGVAEMLCSAVDALIYGLVVIYAFRFAWSAVISARTMQIGSSTMLLWPILWLVPVVFVLVLSNTIAQLRHGLTVDAKGN